MNSKFNYFSGIDPTILPSNVRECFAKLTLLSSKKNAAKEEKKSPNENCKKDEKVYRKSTRRSLLDDLLTDDESDECEDDNKEMNKLFLSRVSDNSFKEINKKENSNEFNESKENSAKCSFVEKLEVTNFDVEFTTDNKKIIGVRNLNTSDNTKLTPRKSVDLFSLPGTAPDDINQLSAKINSLNIKSPSAPHNIRMSKYEALADTIVNNDDEDIADKLILSSSISEAKITIDPPKSCQVINKDVALANTIVDEIVSNKSMEQYSINDLGKDEMFNFEEPKAAINKEIAMADTVIENSDNEIEFKINMERMSRSNRSTKSRNSLVNRTRSESDISIISVSSSSTNIDEENSDVIIVSDSDKENSNYMNVSSISRSNSKPSSQHRGAKELLELFLDNIGTGKSRPNCPQRTKWRQMREEREEEVETSGHISPSLVDSSIEIPETSYESNLDEPEKKEEEQSEETPSKIGETPASCSMQKPSESIKITREMNDGIERINIAAKIRIKLHISEPVKLVAKNEDDSLGNIDGSNESGNEEAVNDKRPATKQKPCGSSSKKKDTLVTPKGTTMINEKHTNSSKNKRRIKKFEKIESPSQEPKSNSNSKSQEHGTSIKQNSPSHNCTNDDCIDSPVLTSDAIRLLNELYGNTWKTPELLSLEKIKLNDTNNAKLEETNLDFSRFNKNVKCNLESTRLNACSIPPKIDNEKKPKTSKTNPEKAPNIVFKKPFSITKVHEKKSPISVKKPLITRSGRNIKHRVLIKKSASSDEEIEDDDQPDMSDHSWNGSSYESSNEDNSGDEAISSKKDLSIKEIIDKSIKKSSDLVYLDLSQDTVRVQDGYKTPDANNDQAFNERLQEVLKDCRYQDKPKIETPNTIKRTKRKLYTPKYCDDENVDSFPMKDLEFGKSLSIEDDSEGVVKLTTPLPAKFYLINKQLEAVKTGTPISSIKKEFTKNREIGTPKGKSTPTSSKTNTPRSEKKKIIHDDDISTTPVDKYGFLKSLDVLIPRDYCHPSALYFKENYKSKKDTLTEKLYNLYNEKLFDNRLDVSIVWNKKLKNTAGRCCNKRRGGVRSCVIELSEKVLTSSDRLRCTLIHELCHAATWIFDGEHGHGATWKNWAKKANTVFPELPKIGVCHQYEIEYKYTYKCTLCGAKSHAHSKSKKVENIRCAFCHGAIEIFLNKKDKDGNILPTPVKEPSGFAKFVKEKYKLFKTPDLKHADVMKILSAEFAGLKVKEMDQNKSD